MKKVFFVSSDWLSVTLSEIMVDLTEAYTFNSNNRLRLFHLKSIHPLRHQTCCTGSVKSTWSNRFAPNSVLFARTSWYSLHCYAFHRGSSVFNCTSYIISKQEVYNNKTIPRRRQVDNNSLSSKWTSPAMSNRKIVWKRLEFQPIYTLCL